METQNRQEVIDSLTEEEVRGIIRKLTPEEIDDAFQAYPSDFSKIYLKRVSTFSRAKMTIFNTKILQKITHFILTRKNLIYIPAFSGNFRRFCNNENMT